MGTFEKIFNYILKVEGGYTNDKYDAGGKTTWGIIEEEARKHGYKGDMRHFSKDNAKEIYFKDYYKKNRLVEIEDPRVQLSVFDWNVNSGEWGLVYFQRALNSLGANLVEDGIIGSKTIEAANKYKGEDVLKIYHEKQRQYYKNLAKRKPSQKKFLKGWLNRVDKKEKYIEEVF